jgi:kumamolisin
LQLPKSVADYVLAIEGLDSYTQAPKPGVSGANFRPLTTTGKRAASAGCSVNGDYLLPQQISSAYGYNAFWKQGYYGHGTTVILPELAAFNANDVQTYLNCVGYRGKLSVFNVAPAPDPNNGGDGQLEATLDIEMVAGMAPYANIEVYQTDGNTTQLSDGSYRDPVHDILNQIVENNTSNKDFKVISDSWGGSEQDTTRYWATTENNDFQYLSRTEHMSIFVASGDCGAYETRQYPSQPAVQFPSSSPYVIGVGGTKLTVDAGGNRADEVVWSAPPKQSTCNNDWGSGGGVSQFFTQPKWQTSVIGSRKTTSREVPDISAAAYYIAMYANGQWEYAYGTSAAAPIWASGWCLLNQMLMNKTQIYFYGPGTLYEAAANNGNLHPFFDVVQGNNLYYSAGPGFDMASGLGSPNLPDLYNVLYPLTKS